MFCSGFRGVSLIRLCHTQPFWMTSCGRCQQHTQILRTSFSQSTTLVAVLLCASSLRRIRLVAERVDGDTEMLRPMAREHIGHAGKGRTCRNAGIRITRCGTLALGNETGVQSKARTSIGGISLQNPLSENLAMRLSRFSAVDENVHPVDLESIATVHGANCLVQAFRRSLGSQIIANVGECTDKSRPHGSVPKTRTQDVTASHSGRRCCLYVQ